jgi:uncharacterized protein YfeS
MDEEDNMNEELDLEELSPENYPKAAQILTDEFYWDCTDEFSPFGNDDGADTFTFFREWREEHSRDNPVRFLDEHLEGWQVINGHWDVVDADEAVKLIKENEFSFFTRDNSIIAVAFGQILVDGKVHPEIKRRGLLAIERQLLPEINNLAGPGHAPERAERFEKMKAVLSQQ